MYFTELTVENIRCFGPEQTLKLTDADGKPTMWTVILGENGTGKTTLLQSMASIRNYYINDRIELHDEISETPKKIPNEIRIHKDDLKEIRKITGSNSRQEEVFLDFSLSECIKSENAPIHIAIKMENKYYLKSNIIVIRFFAKNFGHTYNVEGDPFEITPPDSYSYMAAYGAHRFSYHQDRFNNDASTASLLAPYASLRSPFEWLSQTHHAALMAADKDSPAKQRLAQVKELLIAVLPDVHDIEVTATNDPIPKIKVLFKTDYGLVELDQLSHGYQTMIAWVVDFASRLVEAYPDSPNPLAEPAVCLVDEIDLHLHPRWQREIMSYLSNLFPKTQFIVTAHSPLIVQSAENANVVLLRKEGDHVVIENDKNVVRGWRVDQILTSDLFGLESARPPEYTKLMEERRKLLEKSRLTKKDKARLAELDAALDAMPTGESAADREAMDIIRRAAARLKAEEDKGGAV